MTKNLITNLRIVSPALIGEAPVEVRVRGKGPYTPAATPEDAIAREAVALVDEEEGFRSFAELRRRGKYDGDAEHRAALMAIRLFKEQAQ